MKRQFIFDFSAGMAGDAALWSLAHRNILDAGLYFLLCALFLTGPLLLPKKRGKYDESKASTYGREET